MINRPVKIILWSLAALYVLLVLSFVSQVAFDRAMIIPTFIVMGILLIFGGLLIYFVIKAKFRKNLKAFLFLTGFCAAGIPVFGVLHNLVYGLLVQFMNEGVGDEPFFFILAVVICPLGLLVGLIGSFVVSGRTSQPAGTVPD